MSTLLIPVCRRSPWYDELGVVGSYSEGDFERILKNQVSAIFPDYWTIPYKRLVKAANRESKKPDLALIRKDYSEWWLVELELADHTLEHVASQVETFVAGEFNPISEGEFLYTKLKDIIKRRFSQTKLTRMVRDYPPKVMVIVDDDKEIWRQPLNDLGAEICIFQVYKNTRGLEAYRLRGKYPVAVQCESHCTYDGQIANLMKILSPEVLMVNDDAEISIEYSGRMSRWKCIREGDTVFIRFVGTINPVPANQAYTLSRDDRNKYVLRTN